MTSGFKTDKQTLKDLQIFNANGKSVFSYFDKTVSDGGQEVLRELFFSPLDDIELIKQRQEMISLMMPVIDFNYDRHVLKDLEKYLDTYCSERAKPDFFRKISNVAKRHTLAYYYKERSVRETIETLITLKKYLKAISQDRRPYKSFVAKETDVAYCLKALLRPGQHEQKASKITVFNIDRYDYIIRTTLKDRLKEILSFIYELDAYRSIAIAKTELKLEFPEVCPKGMTHTISIKGLVHLFNDQPVSNDVTICRDRNVWFLTGANMAGKSTFIKALSTAIYLTHIGLPVPAEWMRLDLMDGLFTTINLDDDIDLGYSHFYHEAVRLKNVVDLLDTDSNALIILDELFKGTNYEDSQEAIHRIIRLFSEIRGGPFVLISSHLTELATELKAVKRMEFMRMNIDQNDDGPPTFTYKLASGVAQERLGMWLLDKSGVSEAFKRLAAYRS